MKHLLIFFIFIFLFNNGFCQTVSQRVGKSLYGRLSDENGAPKANILLLLSDLNNKVQRSLFTDSTGNFNFQNIKPGTYFLGTNNRKSEIVKLKTVSVNDSINAVNIGNIIINTEVHQLGEIVVKADRPYIQRKLDKLIVNVDANSLLSGNTLNELLPKLPGVTLNQNNQLVVNGKSNVLVLIDGKGQFVSQEQLAVLLNNMKAESIDKIEIISNPSVRYDANGGAVINIITKKDRMTSDVHTTFGQQISPVVNVSGKNEPNYSVGTNLNYLIGKVRTFASVDYIYDKEFQGNDNTLHYFSPLLTRENLFYTDNKTSAVNTRFGFNTDLDKTTSFDGTFAFYIPLANESNRQYHQMYSSNSSIPDSVIRGSAFDKYYHNRNNTVNLRLIKQLDTSKNEEIDFYFDFNDFNYLDSYGIQNNYFILNNNYKGEIYNSNHNYFVRIYSFKTDYTLKVSSHSHLEAGGKISFIHNTDNYNYIDKVGSVTNADSTLFNYREEVSAVYLNYAGSNALFDYQIGGRLENTSSLGYAPLLNERVPRNYLDFFPAFTIQHNFKSKVRQQIELSFNRRIIRPGYSDFNPNTNMANRFVSRIGDPSLDPQFVNNLELSYNVGSLNISIYDALQNNIKDFIPQPSNQGVVEVDKTLSYSSENDLGFDISYPYSILKWWTSYTSFSGGYSAAKLLDNSAQNYYSYYFSESQSFSINSNNKLDFRFFYRPSTQFNYGRMLKANNLSAGYQVTLLQSKLSLSLNVNDILGDNKLSTMANYPGVTSNNISLRNNRNYSLTLRYNFSSGNRFALRNKDTQNDKSEIRLN